METRQRPRLHGRDHLPGGTDPIPGLQVIGPSGLETILGALGDCTGWWRLGEQPSYPADDGSFHDVTDAFADSAVFEGTARDLDYIEDQTVSGWNATTDRPTFGVAGGPADDDGAILWRGDSGYTGAISGNQPYPHAEGATGNSIGGDALAVFGTNPDNLKTACCWMMPKDYTSPNGNSNGLGFAFSAYNGSGGGGWGFYHYADASFSDSEMGFMYSDTGGDVGGASVLARTGTTPDVWYFLATTWDGTTFRFYVNSVLEASHTPTNPPGGANGVRVGNARIKNGFSDNDFPFFGGVDECMLFRRALTDGELATIMGAGPSAVDGYVLTTQGDGTSEYEFPHVPVLASPPAGPQVGWAYYDTSIPGLRIWDGSSWQAP